MVNKFINVNKGAILLRALIQSLMNFKLTWSAQLFVALMVHTSNSSAQVPLVKPDRSTPLFEKIEIVAGRSISYPIVNKGGEELRVNKFGSVLSATVSRPFTKNLSITARLGFEQKGLKVRVISPPPGDVITTIEDTQNYLTLSGVGRYHVRHFFAGFGPYIGYVISGIKEDKSVQNGVLVSSSRSRVESASYLRRFDLGLNTVVGYELPLTQRMSATIQLLYGLGLVNEHKQKGGQFYNHTFGLVGGVAVYK